MPSFAHWRFPHDDIPKSWALCAPSEISVGRDLPRPSITTAASLTRDITCRLTNHIESTEHAHLVPKSEQDWFNDNGMFRYTNRQRPGTEPINDAQNAILLRSDVHTIFDQKRFVIVPKSSVLVCHIIAPGTSIQLTNLYHNVSLQPLIGIAIQYLLARFAWTIFTQSLDFMQQGLKLNLCIYIGNWETKIAEFTGDQCRKLLGFRSRSRSPKKRLRESWAGTIEDETYDCEEKFRGRKRRRSFDSSWPDSSYASPGTMTDSMIADQEESAKSLNFVIKESISPAFYK